MAPVKILVPCGHKQIFLQQNITMGFMEIFDTISVSTSGQRHQENWADWCLRHLGFLLLLIISSRMSDINHGARGQDPGYWPKGAENLLLRASWRPFEGCNASL
jgi:hypothetical protein